jgi:glycerophosphoryl diester phosphodiesterase
MTAFQGALTLPVDQIETDVRLSADGEPFILHDATLDRTTQATGRATALPFAELSRIRITGTAADCIPHLEAVLTLLAPTAVDLRLELKVDHDGEPQAALATVVLRALERHGLSARTTITSFDRRCLRAVAAAPLAGRIWLVHRAVMAEAGLTGVVAAALRDGISEIALHASQCDALDDRDADASRLRIGLYAVNDAAMIERALALGVSAFTTDRPDLATTARDRLFRQDASVQGAPVTA